MKKVLKKLALTFALSVMPGLLLAESLRGVIRDKSTGEPLIGVSVFVEETKTGDVADLDGHYTLKNLTPGVYHITYQYVGYEPYSLTIHIDGDKIQDIELTETSQNLQEVVVATRALQNNESAINLEMKSSSMVMNAVSAQQIQKAQDKDAAEVIRRIPGISIIDDKFVMVRGLSQRYNNVWMNNAAVPSSEADSRAFSFDIIPSSQLDNVMVVKTQVPEYPADFSGGFILINTKDTPDRNSLSINAGIGTNTQAFRNDFFLSTKDSWNVLHKKLRPDYDFSFNLNQSWNVANSKLSMLLAANYSNKRKLYLNMDNNLFGTYDVYKDQSTYLRHAIDNQWAQNQRVGALFNLSLASLSGRNRYEWKNIFNWLDNTKYTDRNGISNAQGWKYAQGEYSFSQRKTFNTQLVGKHKFGEETKFDWNLGYAYADRLLPDRRIWMKTCDGPLEDIYLQTGNDVTREWTNLYEHIFSAGLNTSHNFHFGNFAPTLRAGLFAEHRTRNYYTTELIYTWDPQTLDRTLLYLPIDEMMAHDDFYTIDYTNHMNDYKGRNTIASAYISMNLPLGKFNTYFGLRYEYTNMVLTLNRSFTEWMPKDHNYQYNDFFPSINTTYKINEKHQLRASYGRSINRPEFRELSTSVFYDFNIGSNIKGNSDLRPSYINNIDLRYEWYTSKSEQISLALFYKHFKDPIESIYIVTGGTDLCYSYQNALKANSYGIEIDARKTLDFIGLPWLSLNANIAFIKSNVKFEEGSQQKDRQMQGQSPYLINLGLFYQSNNQRINLGLLYNRIGKRLIGVGRNASTSEQSANVPDCYEMPRNALDFSASWKCWKELELKLSLRDLINEPIVFMQKTDVILTDGTQRNREEITKSYRPGRTIQFSIGYTF
ncbi:MAG: TonB-dependent receptor [Bacteroidales bacterium]|nr:TonB-dependent receptor [Bacteroidales bacterium]